MNKEILEQLLPIVEKTKDGILKGIEIAQEHVPDLIQQIIAWELAVGYICTIIGFVFMVSIAIIWTILIKKDKAINNLDDDTQNLIYVPSFIFTVIGGLTGILMFTTSIVKIVKISVAPKLFLIEYISNLIK